VRLDAPHIAAYPPCGHAVPGRPQREAGTALLLVTPEQRAGRAPIGLKRSRSSVPPLKAAGYRRCVWRKARKHCAHTSQRHAGAVGGVLTSGAERNSAHDRGSRWDLSAPYS